MHEIGIARKIIEIVLAETGGRSGAPVTEIGVRVGDLSGVDPEALAFTFTVAARGTPLDGAVLSIERVPVRGKCKSCGHRFLIEQWKFICPSCDRRDIAVIEGEELEIRYITERET